MIQIMIFDTVEDIYKLTGIANDKALWDAGFNLDDWDFGVCSEEPLTYTVKDDEGYEFEEPLEGAGFWLIKQMDNYCVGYDHTEYGGKHYYLVHHA